MDSKLRCVFEMPNENDKLVSKKRVRNCHTLTYDLTEICFQLFRMFDLMVKWIFRV